MFVTVQDYALSVRVTMELLPIWGRTQQESNLLITTLQVVGSPLSLVSKIRWRELHTQPQSYRLRALLIELHRITPPSGFEPKKLLPTTEIATLRLTVEAMVAKSNQYRHAHRVVRSVLVSKHDDRTVVDVFTICAIVK